MSEATVTSIWNTSEISSFQPEPQLSLRNAPFIRIPFTVILFLISSLSLFGNSLVITAIFKFKRLYTPTNIVIASLACSDIIVALGIDLDIALEYGIPRSHWTYPFIISRICYHAGVSGSFMTHCLIVIDRHVAVFKPLKYKAIMKPGTAKAMVAGLWFFNYILINIPICVVYGLPIDHITNMENFTDILPTPIMLIYPASIVVGLTINIVLYSKIMHKLWYQQRRFKTIAPQAHSHTTTTGQRQYHGHNTNAKSQTLTETDAIEKQSKPKQDVASSRTRRVTTMMIIVLLTLLACYLPFAAMSTSGITDNATTYGPVIAFEISFCILSSSSALNPLIYAKKNSEFKSAFRRLLMPCYKKKVNPNQENESTLNESVA